ncbi:hypothetical protein ACIQ2D_08195 [Lysinibacillus sp. NPDC097287]|uniref:hypothetical protein n=1 Tax=Lysinibacillus sp. NPDC097287 TaxID=3364144 RepID=UPI0038119539
MQRELKVELRKLLFRWDFYIAGSILIGITSFFMYQLSAEGTFIKIESDQPIELSLNNVVGSIFSMSQHLSLIGIILAILCWHTLGKEVDHRSLTMYFLHSHSKWKLMLSKISVMSIAISTLLSASVLAMLAIYFIFQPEQIHFAGTLSDYQLILQNLLLIILCAILFISLAAIIALRFGSIGVLLATIGLSIMSTIFRENRFIRDFLPLNITDTMNDISFPESITLLVVYIIIVHFILWIVTKRREICV